MGDDLRTRAKESIRRLHAFDGLPGQLASIYDAAVLTIAEYERSLEEEQAEERLIKEAKTIHQEIREAGLVARAASQRRLVTADKEALLRHSKQM